MNLILLYTSDFIDPHLVRIGDRRFQHMRSVHQAAVGETFKVGVLNGLIGQGRVTAMTDDWIELRIRLNQAPPPPLPLSLVMALPRPKMLKRTLETLATLGVKDLWLINSYRVDKSYWSTPILRPEKTLEHLLLGLEQAGDTRLPRVHLRKRFKPFVEDELPAIARHTRALVAHPYQAAPCPAPSAAPTTLAIGPEGGFIPYEVEKLQAAGLDPIHLGPRILRVETAVPVLLSRLFPLTF
ncbi:16S rRNA (uracil(1498)-N(3))-methyltransferase [Marinobacterium weihaiense]|uniref:Ribosomal RNA small subunit methyltransferase E n=1 Tax=Marinobacterium weihaiense TaxID=2851016 RepID=A0ABS6M9R1_9GAMM|nr:16S rRNA (uracil(1498)-N(3))-methyltransferase [Marinobacterium weihaiense]MBV0933024.1 16S rRNA (uracil(1498)-N(3))-methyltransferase [Marinobacterium weihaiense]